MYAVEEVIHKVVKYINEAEKKDIERDARVDVLTTDKNRDKYPLNMYVAVCS
jgi:hypothetical protein